MELREQICDVCHKMWQKGWVAANDGNVSVKLEDGTFLATPTGMSKSFITPEKLVHIDKEGSILEAEDGCRPSSEIKMHLRCYQAVSYTHLTGRNYQAVHLVGGGAQSALLCQMTANACGIPVIAGPVEATVYGNLAMQLVAAGEVKDLKEVRRIIRNSENMKVYEPQDTEQWQEAYGHYKTIVR